MAGLVRVSIWLGPVRASNLGGWIARSLGPWLPVSLVADRNLQGALPCYDRSQRRRIIRAMWDNLGRTAAELPHLGKLRRLDSVSCPGPGWYCGQEAALRNAGGAILFFTGHIGNWEMTLPAAVRLGLQVSAVYRPASNPYVDRLINNLRRQAVGAELPMFAKGAAGGRAAFAHLIRGGSLGLLMDQKLNDGIAVPFFGRPAMTAPSLAVLALHFRKRVIPVRIDRLGPARLALVMEPPLPLPNSGDRKADVLELTAQVNRTLERWITARPESWLWLHRRWPK